MAGLYTIPLSQPFVDVLAAGLLHRAGGDTLQLPRTTKQTVLVDASYLDMQGGGHLSIMTLEKDLKLATKLGQC